MYRHPTTTCLLGLSLALGVLVPTPATRAQTQEEEHNGQQEAVRTPEEAIARLRELGGWVNYSGTKDVDFSFCDEMDEVIPLLAEIPEFEWLRLVHCNVTDEHMQIVGKLETLTSVTINGCEITTLEPLANLRELESLNVDSAEVGDLALTCPQFLYQGL